MVVSLSPWKVLGSIPGLGEPFCEELARSPGVSVGFLRVFQFPPTMKNMHHRLIIQRVSVTKITDGDLVPRRSAAPQKRVGQNAENKLYCK